MSKKTSVLRMLETFFEHYLLNARMDSCDDIKKWFREMLPEVVNVNVEDATNDEIETLDYELICVFEFGGEEFWLSIYYAKTRTQMIVTEILLTYAE